MMPSWGGNPMGGAYPTATTGGANSSTGGANSSTGGANSSSGGANPSTGGANSSTSGAMNPAMNPGMNTGMNPAMNPADLYKCEKSKLILRAPFSLQVAVHSSFTRHFRYCVVS